MLGCEFQLPARGNFNATDALSQTSAQPFNVSQSLKSRRTAFGIIDTYINGLVIMPYATDMGLETVRCKQGASGKTDHEQGVHERI